MDTLTSQHNRRAVIRRELAWHEQEQAERRRRATDQILYRHPAFAPVVAAGVEFLQEPSGERVLEMGCGVGSQAQALAARGLRVIAVDLSRMQLRAARRLARARGRAAGILFVQANAEELPFASGAFRRIYGKAILHHLDLALAAREVQRVLAAGGRASFAEPLAGHPLIRWARRLTPALRTPDEHPLRPAELADFAGQFRARQTETFFLLAPLAYPLRSLPLGERPFRWVHSLLVWLDSVLFAFAPGLRRRAWYAVVNVEQ